MLHSLSLRRSQKDRTRKTALEWEGRSGAAASEARRAEAEDEHPRRTEQDSAFVTDSELTGRWYMSHGIGLRVCLKTSQLSSA